MRGVAAAIAAAVVTAGLTAGSAQASTLDLFGYGMRSPALAGTGAATADDYESVYANPAGLAEARAKRATVGVVAANFSLKLDGDTASDAGKGSGTVLGGVIPMPLGGWAKDRIGLGFGLYIPNDTLNRVRAPFPGQPSFALLENRSHVIAVQLGVGVKVSDRWSVGAAVIALAALTGHIDVTSDAGGRFTADSEERLIAHFSPVVGARWRKSDRLALGAVLRFPARSDYDILVTNDLGDAIPLELPLIRIAGCAQYDPLTLAAEGAYQYRDLTLIGQLAYQRWSAFPLPTKNPVTGTPPQQKPGFHDTVVPRLGVEWTRPGAVRLAARVGYAFVWTPAPEMTGQQSLLDNTRHVLGVGFGIALTGKIPIRLDVFAQFHHLMFRRHVKDPALQPVGEPPPFDAISTKGNVYVAGAAIGVDL